MDVTAAGKGRVEPSASGARASGAAGGALPVRPVAEPASDAIHVVSCIDATEPRLEPFATHDLPVLSEAARASGGHVSAEVMLDRFSLPPGVKIVDGLCNLVPSALAGAGGLLLGATLASTAPPVAAGISLLSAAWLFLTRKRMQEAMSQIDSGLMEHRLAGPGWDGRRTYVVGPNGAAQTSQHALPQRRTSDAAADFIASGVAAAPHALNVVALMGHGLGYRYGAGYPFAQYQHMLETAAKRTGRPLDLLVLESCLQGNLEALAATCPFARYAVVSEASVHEFSTLDTMRDALREVGGRTVTARDLGAAMVKHADDRRLNPAVAAYRWMADRGSLDGSRWDTLSLVDMAKVPALVAAVDRLGALLADEAAAGRTKPILQALHATRKYPDWADLGDLRMLADGLVERYAAAPSPGAKAIVEAARTVLQTLEAAQPAHYFNPSQGPVGGISVQLPVTDMKALEQTPVLAAAGVPSFDSSAAPAGWKKFVAAMEQRG